MSVDFVDAHKGEHGVEPILNTLAGTPVGIAPSTYYAAKLRPASRRALSDAGLIPLIAKIHRDNYGVYGARRSGINSSETVTATSPGAPWNG